VEFPVRSVALRRRAIAEVNRNAGPCGRQGRHLVAQRMNVPVLAGVDEHDAAIGCRCKRVQHRHHRCEADATAEQDNGPAAAGVENEIATRPLGRQDVTHLHLVVQEAGTHPGGKPRTGRRLSLDADPVSADDARRAGDAVVSQHIVLCGRRLLRNGNAEDQELARLVGSPALRLHRLEEERCDDRALPYLRDDFQVAKPASSSTCAGGQ